MTNLIAAVVFFVGLHFFVSATALRGILVARLGERTYLALFSLTSAAGLAWMIWAFLAARTILPTLWPDLRWLAAILNLLAFVFVVLGLIARSPTVVMGESALEDPQGARGIHRITRHPFLFGIGLWAATHMLFNPHPATLWFFGGFLALALVGPRSIDAKRAHSQGAKWERYAAQTSALPFLAIVQGRNRLVWSELGLAKLVIAGLVWAAFLLLHGRMFGIPAV